MYIMMNIINERRFSNKTIGIIEKMSKQIYIFPGHIQDDYAEDG